MRRFLMGSSESESEDERRVVRSAKDRATEDLYSICNDIRVCTWTHLFYNFGDIVNNQTWLASTSFFLRGGIYMYEMFFSWMD